MAALIVLAFAASPAKAAFGIESFEALTCKTDESLPGLGDWKANGDPCLDEDEIERFYTQAAGHPPFGITAFLMNQGFGESPKLPDGFIKELRTELPEGLGVNPEATPQCTRAKLAEVVAPGPPLATKCTTEVPGSMVGINYLTTLAPPPAPPETEVTVPVLVYNLEPEFGEPSSAGFNATGKPTILESDLDPGDQHISFTIHDLESPLAGGAPVIGSRLVFNGEAGEGYLTMPSNCAGPQVTKLIVHSHPYPLPPEGVELEDTASYATKVGADGCDEVPFEPEVEATSSGSTDSPEPATAEVKLPYNPDPEDIQGSHLLTADLLLPPGTGLNPSVGNGLVACSDAQYGKGTNNPIACPAASEIGTVEVETPALPETLGGTVYVGAPLSDNPSSGDQFRMFIHVSSPKFGVNVRLVGNIFPNLQTGRLRVVVDENPQAPFTSFKVHINGGPRGALTTPGTCGPHTTTATFTPWSGTENVTDESTFTLTTLPGGGPCPDTLAQRPFDVTYSAGTRDSKAGAFTPFDLKVTRKDGEQELKRIDVKLPPGMIARLRGLEYCPESNIAAAENGSGRSALAKPPCPDSSFVGTSDIKAGAGPAPYETAGNIYLAGPYKGAPVSLVFATPAVAGPYDLGTVVVRVALYIDPETVEVDAVSDPIPDVFGGVKLDIREIELSVFRPSFTINPTTCRTAFPITGDLFGGSSDPTDPGAWLKLVKQSQFQGTRCKSMQFKPKFFAKIFGGKNQMRRAKNPKFRAVIQGRDRDSNVRRAAFILPRATILDQSHIRTVCTRVQLADDNCPKAAIYGNARATSKMIDGNLKGPVYLVSSDNELPDLLADLKGQVNVRLRGVISAKSGRLKTVFRNVPDVSVRKFTLTMKGGSRGLLVNSQNLCAKKRRNAFLNLKAQNSRRLKVKKLRLNIPGCKGKKGKKKGKK
jgi:hypothetical protein